MNQDNTGITMVNVTFKKSESAGGESIGTVPAGSSILQAAMAAGVQVNSTCGGKGTCGKCHVILSPEDRGEPLAEEKKLLSSEKISLGVVLACKRLVKSDLEVNLIEQKDVFERKAQLERENPSGEVAPLIRKQMVKVSIPSAEDQRSDWERLAAELPDTFISSRFNPKVVSKVPKVLRQANFQVTAVTAEDELLAVEAGDTLAGSYGLAIDIGTTTIVVYLMDLNSGKIMGRGALTNPQQGAGADVVSRIVYVGDHSGGLEQLQSLVVKGLNQIIAKLCRENKLKIEEIYHAVVVGNTTMSHLFLGIDPAYLARAPFIPCFRQAAFLSASELGLGILSEGKVTVLPIVAGYVGSDTVGVMIASRIDELEGIHLLVDIGTNGEIILAGKGRILTCSTAAGPAFEGAGIKYGMRAAAGAIEHVKIDGDVKLGVIGDGNEKVQGICGSGLIDAVSEMYKAGIIDTGGRMNFSEKDLLKLPKALGERMQVGNESKEFILVRQEDSASGETITITQKDIRELQLAKGAVLAGIRVLMFHLGVRAEDIDRIHLAGAFGSYIDRESALGIGLLPQIPLAKIQSIGNAAGKGAQMVLLSTAEMARAQNLARKAEHIELSTESIFQKEFLKSLALGQS